jgi:hypothetical protein
MEGSGGYQEEREVMHSDRKRDPRLIAIGRGSHVCEGWQWLQVLVDRV